VGEEAFSAGEKMRRREEESDLKKSHVRLLNECDRSHLSALDHIHASVCVKWASAFEPTCVNSSVSPCLRSSVQLCARSQSAKQNFFFLKQNIYKNKKQKGSPEKSTPIPNLKWHIAHNVTRFTKPKEQVNSGIA
jgi:hypothetical protein